MLPEAAPPAADPDAGAPEPGGEHRHVVCAAAGARFALPLRAVLEVAVLQPPLARVPRAGPGVRGAMNLRGRVVAVVELGAALGRTEPLGPGPGHVVVLDRGRRALGVLVASVLGIEPLPPSALQPCGGAGPALGVAALRGAEVTVLDADALEQRAAALVAP